MESNKYPETTVGAFIFDKQGKLLLVKSHKWKNKYVVPGGHIELGEKINEALEREVKEETGLTIKNPKLFNVQDCIYSKEFIKEKHFVFLEMYCEAETTKVKIDNQEAQDFVWADPQEALKMNVDSFTKKSLRKYLKLKNDEFFRSKN